MPAHRDGITAVRTRMIRLAAPHSPGPPVAHPPSAWTAHRFVRPRIHLPSGLEPRRHGVRTRTIQLAAPHSPRPLPYPPSAWTTHWFVQPRIHHDLLSGLDPSCIIDREYGPEQFDSLPLVRPGPPSLILPVLGPHIGSSGRAFIMIYPVALIPHTSPTGSTDSDDLTHRPLFTQVPPPSSS